MLVMKRNTGEAITIETSDGLITIVNCGESPAKIGIEAPREIPILRDDAIRRAPLAAVGRPSFQRREGVPA